MSQIGGAEHLSILEELVGAGASLDEDLNTREQGLADIARATSPEAEKRVAKPGAAEA